jgi:DNA polymerase elongation subunit (family B)
MDLMILDLLWADAVPEGLDTSAPFYGPDADDALSALEAPEAPPAATLMLLGRDSSGKSVCCTVQGYCPWTRLMWTSDAEPPSIADMKAFVMKCLGGPDGALGDQARAAIVDSEDLPKFYGFEKSRNGPEARKFRCFKVRLPTFQAIQKLEWSIARVKHRFGPSLVVTDTATPPDVKAVNDLGLVISGWVHIREPGHSSHRISTADIHITSHVNGIEPRDLPSIAPIKIMSFDAEMYSHDNGFPEVIHGDHTIAVCASVMQWGTPGIRRYAFVVWTSEPLKIETPGLHVTYCESPIDLIEQFRDFVAAEDPDLMTGWNIYGFDMPFLWDEYASAYTGRKDRGSEALHGQILSALKRPFQSLRDLLKQARGHSLAKDAYRREVSKVQMRHRSCVAKPEALPEVVARKLRSAILDAMAKEPEATFGGPADLEAIRGSLTGRSAQIFESTIGQPTLSGFKRGQFWSRMLERSKLEEKRMASAAKGDNTYYFWSGRPCVDLMHIIKDDKKLDDNSLKFAAQTFLDPEYGKIDMSPAEIFAAWRTQDPEKMARMLDYCARDSDIPLLLIEKLSYVPIWIEMSRVTYTSLQKVLNGGQQRKVYNLIARFVHGTHAINKCDSGWPVADDASDSSGSALEQVEDALRKRRPDYQGATVIDPIAGFYTDPVSTLDFESLYPSIIIHFNLCPSVYVIERPFDGSGSAAGPFAGLTVEDHTIKHAILKDASTDLYEEFEKTYSFVKNVQGVVPKLLQHLLKARKVAKRAMADAPDEFARDVQNGRQLALKVSCNSVYGFFGVAPGRGMLSCKPVAAVTTLRGRAFIDAAKTYVEANYAGARVLYGDTDSIMINWGATSVPRAYQLAEEASAAITELLRSGAVPGASKPVLASATSAVTLANEKVYCPFLLIQKKNYAAFKYLLKARHKPDGIDDFDTSIDMKGIDAVRRDRSKLIKSLSSAVLDALLLDKSLDKAVDTLRNALDMVADQKAPLDWFVLSKSLKSTYHSENQPHVQAWRRMGARGDTDVPEIGTRMPFVIVAPKGTYKHAKALYERSEHPEYVTRAKLQYCARYYLENAQDVIERLLGPTGLGPTVRQFFSDALVKADHRASGNMSLMSFKKSKSS